MAFEMTTLALYEQAVTLIEEGIALSLREGNRRDAAHLGVRLALFAREQGRFDRAESVLQESLAVFRELKDVPGTAWALIGLCRPKVSAPGGPGTSRGWCQRTWRA
jgi:hypothetical protein